MSTANQLFDEGRPDEVALKLTELIEANPDFATLRYWRSIAYALCGRLQESIEDATTFVELQGGTWFSKLNLAWVYAMAGRSGEAAKLASDAIEDKEKTYVSPTDIGMVKLALGEKDEAYSWLGKAFDERDPMLLYFNGMPWMKEFRDDPRWASIESRFGSKREPS
jgi:tetratricopeptide (TPR) repeat protein